MKGNQALYHCDMPLGMLRTYYKPYKFLKKEIHLLNAHERDTQITAALIPITYTFGPFLLNIRYIYVDTL